MKLLYLISVVFLFFTDTHGQFNRKLKSQNNSPYPAYQKNEKGEKLKPAEFPGGMAKLYTYIDRKLKYPKDAKRGNIQGNVSVEFIIGTGGEIKRESVRVVKGLYTSCDNEAIRLIKECPNWIPAMNIDTGEKLEMKYITTVSFKL